MITFSPTPTQTTFTGLKSNFNISKKFIMPVIAGLCLGTATPLMADTFQKRENPIELIDNVNQINEINNPTQLSVADLDAAPSPVVIIANKETMVGIVVDRENNKLYRYDNEGNVIDGYKIATGRIENGKSLTTPGIRRVHHIENFPYQTAYGTKRKSNPKAYGPNVLVLNIINPETGAEGDSNGEFIHGNNDFSSLGTHASGGCMRMDNKVIKQFAKEVKPGTLVLIK